MSYLTEDFGRGSKGLKLKVIGQKNEKPVNSFCYGNSKTSYFRDNPLLCQPKSCWFEDGKGTCTALEDSKCLHPLEAITNIWKVGICCRYVEHHGPDANCLRQHENNFTSDVESTCPAKKIKVSDKLIPGKCEFEVQAKTKNDKKITKSDNLGNSPTSTDSMTTMEDKNVYNGFSTGSISKALFANTTNPADTIENTFDDDQKLMARIQTMERIEKRRQEKLRFMEMRKKRKKEILKNTGKHTRINENILWLITLYIIMDYLWSRGMTSIFI